MIVQKLLNKLLSFFIIIIVILFCLGFYVIFYKVEQKPLTYLKKSPKKFEEFEPIIGNSLFLSLNQCDMTVPVIKDQLEIYIIEPRFDSPIKNINLEVKFRNSNKVIKVREKEKVYLIANNEGFDFSDNKTSFSAHFELLNLNDVRVILEADLKELNIDDFKQKICDSFIVATSELTFSDNLEDKYEFKLLMNGKWLGIDCFLDIYNKNKTTFQKERLEIDGDILYVENKDILIFKEGKWIIPSLQDNTLDYPLARIKDINTKSIEIEAWNVFGNTKYSFFIFHVPKSSFLTKADQLITLVKKRTNTHISCMIDKQRFVLKEKDLLIKKENRWKLLKRDAVLEDVKNEELFYFEKIEDRNAKKVLIGYLFNPMRTNFQKIEVPINLFTNRRINKR